MNVRLPTNTIRLRLTLAYGVLFLASGAALLTLTYFLARTQYTKQFFIGNAKVLATESGSQSGSVIVTGSGSPGPVGESTQIIGASAQAQSGATLHTLLVDSAIALGAMSVLSLWLGWLVAGRALEPLRTITNTARSISAQNLHRRLALEGPDDELKQLGNTFDDLLARLERAFEAQQQFVSNASHELRTPLTYERTLLEVVLANPNADAQSLRKTCEKLLANSGQQERLIEALLTLARSQRGIERREPVDLATVAAACLTNVETDGLELEATLLPAPTAGDARLLERLASNLIANGVRHNVAGGELEIRTETRNGTAVLAVTNTGPVVEERQLDRLFEPFHRLGRGRSSDDGGLGLGLSIVQAIARAHDAELSVRPRSGGGLVVEAAFPKA